jgi:hypothetical protein
VCGDSMGLEADSKAGGQGRGTELMAGASLAVLSPLLCSSGSALPSY